METPSADGVSCIQRGKSVIITIDDWKFDIDPEMTREHSAYSVMRHCTCAYCENYYRSVNYVCPELKPFLSRFGSDVEGPVEMFPFEPTICLVSYRITGQILEYGFGPIMVDHVPVLPKAEDSRQFKLEVGEIELPWVMLEDPNEVVSPANEPEFLEQMYRRLAERRSGDFFICS